MKALTENEFKKIGRAFNIWFVQQPECDVLIHKFIRERLVND